MPIATNIEDGALGANINRVDIVAAYAVGTILRGNQNSEFVYCSISAAQAASLQGQAYIIDANFAATLASTTNSPRGAIVGFQVTSSAISAGNFAWLQRKGQANIRTAAAAVVNARMNTTATAGAIDDDGTVGAKQIEGVALTTAAGAAGAFEGVLNYPIIGVTL